MEFLLDVLLLTSYTRTEDFQHAFFSPIPCARATCEPTTD
jgi:hypothetical protein